jgi:hypothetical protein
MMQINAKNIFNNISQTVFFEELCDAKGPLTSIVHFTRLFNSAHFSIYYQHGWYVERVIIIESL